MICVFGCLDTENGVIIHDEMVAWLKQSFTVFSVHQQPPGKDFEYPAIKIAIDASIRLNEPVLYIHTKGAANVNSKAWDLLKQINFKFPEKATPKDLQIIVRNMWKHEFTKNIEKYKDAVNTNKPVVACPYTGSDKTTWQNAFIINPSAAKELLKTFHLDKNRFYYERMFTKTNINVIGIRLHDVERDSKIQVNMWNDLFQNFY